MTSAQLSLDRGGRGLTAHENRPCTHPPPPPPHQDFSSRVILRSSTSKHEGRRHIINRRRQRRGGWNHLDAAEGRGLPGLPGRGDAQRESEKRYKWWNLSKQDNDCRGTRKENKRRTLQRDEVHKPDDVTVCGVEQRFPKKPPSL